MAETIEIITGRERRHRWSVEDKLRVVAATYEPGTCVGQVAASNDVRPGLVFTWRRLVCEGRLGRSPVMAFLPVRAAAPAPISGSEPLEKPGRPVGQIEIELRDGCRVRVDPDVGLAALRRVIAALRG